MNNMKADTVPPAVGYSFQDMYSLEESEEASTGEGKEPPGEDKQQNELLTLAARLLEEWATLKEVFRIPKKERIEQMKEHEREAGMRLSAPCSVKPNLTTPSSIAASEQGHLSPALSACEDTFPYVPCEVEILWDMYRGYKEYLDREEHHDKQSYDRHWRRPEHDRPRNKRSRESPDPDRNRKGSRYEDRVPHAKCNRVDFWTVEEAWYSPHSQDVLSEVEEGFGNQINLCRDQGLNPGPQHRSPTPNP
uniref:Uncharacterized protein n=1 Tax=Timema monikensis TaxID=170555 RepID=A0A7R9EFD8_9NEOP|nr:unnamed protein product [Timema monikensis]